MVVVSIHMHTFEHMHRAIDRVWGVDLVEQDTEASCGKRGSPLPSTLTTPSFDFSSSADAGKLPSLSAAAMLRPPPSFQQLFSLLLSRCLLCVALHFNAPSTHPIRGLSPLR